jgi:hypothetical protein
MQEFISLNGYTVKDAEARNRISSLESETGNRISSLEVPSLPEEKRLALKSISNAYFNNRTKFYYEFSPNRNIYATKGETYTDNAKARINCANFAQLVWAGISPETFFNVEGYDGTIVKSLDWGYWFRFFNRRVSGKTNSDGSLIHFVKPNEENYEGSYSWNSYYSEGSEREDGQIFKSYMDAADMAHELYVMGCEIPINKVQMGDLVFFEAQHLNDGQSDGFQQMCFRNIGHVAFVHNVTFENGRPMFNFVHSMDFLGASTPITSTYADASSNWDRTYYAALENTICMVARHPAAFGISNPVGDKFTKI